MWWNSYLVFMTKWGLLGKWAEKQQFYIYPVNIAKHMHSILNLVTVASFKTTQLCIHTKPCKNLYTFLSVLFQCLTDTHFFFCCISIYRDDYIIIQPKDVGFSHWKHKEICFRRNVYATTTSIYRLKKGRISKKKETRTVWYIHNNFNGFNLEFMGILMHT